LRRIALSLCAGLPVFASCPDHAQATLAVDLVWIATTGSGTTGSSTIEAEPGDELTLEIAIVVDEVGVESYRLSVLFDFGSADELDIVSTEELGEPDGIPTVDCTPFPACFTQPVLNNADPGIEAEIESTRFQSGLAQGFEAFNAIPTQSDGPVSFRSPIGRIVFLVTDRVARDTMDLEGSILTDSDGYLDNDGNFVGLEDLPNPALVPGFAPEPGAPALALAALATVAWLRRSRRARPRPRRACAR
jgi:hypothetical protein